VVKEGKTIYTQTETNTSWNNGAINLYIKGRRNTSAFFIINKQNKLT